MRVLVITDNKAGNQAQALGLAEALAEEIEMSVTHWVITLAKPWIWFPPNLVPRFFSGLSGADERSMKEEPAFDCIIGCGRQSVSVIRYFKQFWHNKPYTVQILDPHVSLHHFDRVIIPDHDEINGPNVIQTIGAMNRVNDERLEQSRSYWQGHWTDLPGSKVAVMLGGSNKVYDFDAHQAAVLGDHLQDLHAETGASFLLTASRRSGEAAIAVLKQALSDIPHYFWDGNGDNPYFGFLACADHIVVSSDSVNMVSEACFTGKPVYVYHLKSTNPGKFSLFHNALEKEGYTERFKGVFLEGIPKRLYEAKRVAAIVAQELKNRE